MTNERGSRTLFNYFNFMRGAESALSLISGISIYWHTTDHNHI